MFPAQRGADGPVPGDLFLDPDVPDAERVTVVRAGGAAQASHVWTGAGWSRLGAGPVALVPSVRPQPVRRQAVATLTLLQGGQDEHAAGPVAAREPAHPIAV
jgi:hypothetical protein